MKKTPLFRAGVLTLAIPVLVAASWTPARAVAPPNDYFNNAITIDPNALPFVDSQTINEATTEFGEQFYCNFSTQSVWYRFTPTSDMWVQVNNDGSSVYGNISVYRQFGSTISDLNFFRCSYYDPGPFKLFAGTTYYVQSAAGCCGQSGVLRTNLSQTPAPSPVANFYFDPSEPSTFDLIRFYDQSYDPGNVNITAHAWEFGDGAVDTGYAVYHNYKNDGDYQVRLVVTTSDGRTGELIRPVVVRTHDVAITKFKVPQSASAGQTRAIEVGIRNTRYPENVRVELYRSVPSGYYPGWEYFATLQQFVPVRSSNRTTDFSFSYTFSGQDALIGKVNFRAVATIMNARDALATDNEAISLPVKVSGNGNYSPPVDSTQTPVAPPVAPLEIAGTGLPSRLELRSVSPNPARADGALSVRLALPVSGNANIKVVDLSGRIVTERDLGWLAAGVRDQRISWDRRPTPGIYWVNLTQAGKSASTRLAVLQ